MNIRILSSKDKGNPSSALWRKNNFSGNSKCPNLKVWQEASPGKERKKKKWEWTHVGELPFSNLHENACKRGENIEIEIRKLKSNFLNAPFNAPSPIWGGALELQGSVNGISPKCFFNQSLFKQRELPFNMHGPGSRNCREKGRGDFPGFGSVVWNFVGAEKRLPGFEVSCFIC